MISRIVFPMSIILVAATYLFTQPAIAQETNTPASRISFNDQIRPILSRHCTACHGPDEASRQAGLRLDTFAGATESAIDPGDPDFSDLIDRVTSVDDPMPPTGHGERLTGPEIALLRQWIEEGANYETHWAFVKPQATKIPDLRTEEYAHPIDMFVLQKSLQDAQDELSPQADPARLIRRVALDLTGLPPDQRLVDSFVADSSDANYERVIDQLLADQSFGEHWASMWLDLARYADTVGYAGDEKRTIWPWRDWLIKALNENKPFDQFTKEMLAGDLLPDPTEDQRLATAFHRNTLNNNEGGTNDEEFRTIAVKDRLSTTLNTWMGLTVRCAECHSHKYDPINHTEYHQLLDFFNQTADADRGNEHPVIKIKPRSLKFKMDQIDAKISDLRMNQKRRKPVWQQLTPHAWESASSELQLQEDGSLLSTGPNPAHDEVGVRFNMNPGVYTGLRLKILPSPYHDNCVGRGEDGSFVLSQLVVMAKQPGQNSFGDVALQTAAASSSAKDFAPEKLIRNEFADPDDPAGWTFQQTENAANKEQFVILQFKDPLIVKDSFELLVLVLCNHKKHFNNPGRLKFSITSVEKPVEKFNKKQLDPIQQQIDNLIRQRNQPLQVPVLAELPADQQRTTHIMKRGNFQNLGPAVKADTPGELHPLPKDVVANRLGIAEWLVDSQNPLTARVSINRLWARLFGQGIVVTEEDFGTQGSPPSHPELLDWLAIDFASDWDTKRALKQIVMSRTYRQSSKATAEQIKSDPDNTYLTRGPRVRLPAETIRDQALAVSGLLSRKMYGPPVYPPNPIKQVVNAFKGAEVWATSTGEDRYRRSIYTFLKRSQPHPLFETFDTSTRDVCSLRRINTNTPLQSFMTLNDEAFFEAAQALAVRMLEQTTAEQRIKLGLETALLHPANPQQTEVLVELYSQSAATFRTAPDQTTAVLGSYSSKIDTGQHAELAALTVVANVILNLDEFLTH